MSYQHRVLRASAGTGKTHQLTNQYIRLLMAGAEPESILATTFTRKAAAEILDRVLSRLADAAGDAKAAKELAKQIEVKSATQKQFEACLTRVLRGLHRIRIGTIDSFNMALAGSFGLELGFPAAWSICEQTDDELICREAIEALLDRYPDDLTQLLSLLSKGDVRRSVQSDLQWIIDKLYATFRGTERSAWERLEVPPPVPAEKLAQAFERLRELEFDHKKIAEQHAKDIDRFRREDWGAFVGSGWPAVLVKGQTKYYNQELSPEAREVYTTLLDHARARAIRELADQSQASWEFLSRFDAEVWALKRANGSMRFDDVTHALAVGMKGKTLRDEGLAYRLDGACRHVLFDEFQDTALSQWHAVSPLSRRSEGRSFFCVGDVKQAIYRWRGGLCEIFNLVGQSSESIAQSWRSDKAVIEVVNEVFGNLTSFESEKCEAGLRAWQGRFETHTTVKKEIGYVSMRTGPGQKEGERVVAQRVRHCEYVAEKIRDLAEQMPNMTIGVLCRKNDTLARMMFELRRKGVEASEEGGNSLDDSPAVEVILSLFTLADHPSHSVAWFHLQNSPLKEHLGLQDRFGLSAQLRRDLFTKGCGQFVQDLAQTLAPACDPRDLRRLQQLVETAYGYEGRNTLRADDFVTWVRSQRMPDPTDAKVRVMTIHTAKGLEFDVVVLPEMDESLLGLNPPVVVRRDPESLQITFVCRYVKASLQQLLSDQERRAFDEDRRQRVEDSLCLLYVAMTRAIHALYLYIPGPRKPELQDSWYKLLLSTLTADAERKENVLVFDRGDKDWFRKIETSKTSGSRQPAAELPRIEFSAPKAVRRRGLEHVAPSRHEGDAAFSIGRLFDRAGRLRTSLGTLYHAWFAAIEWLDEGIPSADMLRAIAEKARNELPPEIWHDLDTKIAEFQSLCQSETVGPLLRRAAYERFGPLRVERERRFIVHENGKFWSGSVDRLVWLGDKHVIAADVIDFKTDEIPAGNEAALAKRIEHYRPQLEAYRQAVARLGELAPGNVGARLLFTAVGRVVELCQDTPRQPLLF